MDFITLQAEYYHRINKFGLNTSALRTFFDLARREKK